MKSLLQFYRERVPAFLAMSALTALVGCAGSAQNATTDFSEMTDGLRDTIVVGTVDAAQCIPWTKPHDIVVDDSFQTRNNGFIEGNFMLGDGGIIYVHIEDDLDPTKFRRLFTIADGQGQRLTELYPPDQELTFPPFAMESTEERIQVSNSLKEIARALHEYHKQHGHLPPAITYGPDGTAWHSWRVMILPQLNRNDLYQRYDQSVSWEHEKNASVLREIPDVYHYPNTGTSHDTRYLAATGMGTAFPVGTE